MRTLGHIVTVAAAVTALGCGTMHSAVQVGGKDTATWVYVQQSGLLTEAGIYRCKDTGKKITCHRADMSD
jgi:hypothetical protein